MKQTRIIFNDEFYTLQAILHSSKFQRLEKELRNILKDNGLPLPANGFKSVKEYHAWMDKVNNNFSDYHVYFDRILKEFGVFDNKNNYIPGFSWYLYFGKKKAPLNSTYKMGIKTAEDKKSLAVNLTIYSFTREEDLLETLWPQISLVQKKLDDYKPRNREWETFERDLKVYELFLEVSQNLKQKIKVDPNVKSNSPYIQMLAHPEFKRITKKYKLENLDESVRSIISRCKKKFRNLHLL